jgi:hypothetical protein
MASAPLASTASIDANTAIARVAEAEQLRLAGMPDVARGLLEEVVRHYPDYHVEACPPER